MGSIPVHTDPPAARAVWARTVRHLRHGRGWSQPQLAAALIAADTHLRRLARDREHVRRRLIDFEGAHRLPSEDYAIAFICTFATPEELASGSISDGSELDLLMCALDRMGVPVDRRRFLLNAAATALTGSNTFRDWQPTPQGLTDPERVAWALAHPRHADPTTLRLMQAQALDVLRGAEARPPHLVLAAAQAWLERAAVLRSHASREPVLTEVAALEALAAAAAGRAAHGAIWEPELAERYYRRALAAAGAAGPAMNWVAAFAAQDSAAFQLLRRHDPQGAGRLSEQAVLALDGRSPTAASLVYATCAEVRAGQGDRRGAQEALDLARAWLDRVPEDDPLAGLFPPARADNFEGSAWLLLDQPERAIAPLEATVARLDPSMTRPLAYGLGNLAYALARQGEVERACSVAGEAAGLLATTHEAGGLGRLQAAVGELLRRAPGEPCVQEARDRLLALRR